ncbi:MAG: hypothetical protein INH41_15725 [Myxococcaceae bacterium]|nr:hypothetical protein [Myxococcaceae bacterium]
MEMYRSRSDEPVAAAGSVLTRKGGAQPTREEFRDAITALSTLAWLDQTPSADPWLFEVWSVPNDATPADGFRRVSKFSTNHTDPQVDRVRPSPYVFPITLRPDIPKAVTAFVEAELLKGPENAVLRALGQLHEVRFETPYFTSLGNDIEALWTGFEAFLLPSTPPRAPPSEGGLLHRLRRALHVLLGSSTPKLMRSERLAAAIGVELAVPGVRPETLAGINAFVERLWAARNSHSHAGHTEPPIALESLGTTALSAGLRLFPLLLKIRIARTVGDEIFIQAPAVERLNEIFLRERTIESVVGFLGKEQGKNWYPPGPERTEELERLKSQLIDLVGFESVAGWAERREVAKARGFVRRVLTAWLKGLQATGPAGAGADYDGLANFPTLDASCLKSLKAAGITGTALEDALDDQLVEEAISSDLWRDPAPNPSLLGRAIPLWLWVRTFVRLHELFIGYERV